MKKFVFAALALTAIIWGTMAGAFRQSPQGPLTMKEIAAVLLRSPPFTRACGDHRPATRQAARSEDLSPALSEPPTPPG
jgi:hypothetical protein